jgi:hypothetical protein
MEEPFAQVWLQRPFRGTVVLTGKSSSKVS